MGKVKCFHIPISHGDFPHGASKLSCIHFARSKILTADSDSFNLIYSSQERVILRLKT